MSHSVRRLMVSGLILLTTALMFSNPALAGGSPAGGRAADNPTQAVKALIHGYYIGPQGQRMQVPAHFAGCFPMPGKLAACPITPRLANRLRHPDPKPAGCLGSCTLDPVSRSQNTTQHLTLRVAANNGAVAQVNTQWGYTYNVLRFTFVVRHDKAGWLVDDEYCTGHPSATIYKVPIRPCPATGA